MEIHRPKPFHGWRELAKEVGVITIGIAIALGGEETLRWLDRRAEVAEARRALRVEIADNARNALVVMEEERCLEPLADFMIGVSNGVGKPARSPPSKPPVIDMAGPVTSTWDVVKVGAAARMPFEERVAYSRFYDTLSLDRRNYEVELSAWDRTAGHFAKASLTPDDRRRLIEDLSQARIVGRARAREARKRLADARAMGITPSLLLADQRASIAQLCGYAGMQPTLAP
jgi:hypothetical protein